MQAESAEKCRSIYENPKSVFSVLTDSEKLSLHRNLVCMLYKKGEKIFSEGDKPEGLVFLSEGKVKLYMEGVGGREQIIRLASPGGFIGYRAYFAGEKHNATAVAIDECIACFVHEKVLMLLMASNPQLSLNIIRSFAVELGASYNRTVNLTQKHLRGRIAEALLSLHDTYGYDKDGATLRANMSREEIANLSNMTTSNAIRTLSNLAHEGILQLVGKKIRIVDFDRLKRVSELG